MELVCRIQDKDGRGPYKPGFSYRWSERESGGLPIYLAFPGIVQDIQEYHRHHGGSFGCAFDGIGQAEKWFSPSEVLTLSTFGYALCWMNATVLAKNDDQLVIWTPYPLAKSVIHKGWSIPKFAPAMILRESRR